ncbi:MAG: dihydrolipoyl dehydrogenase [Bdellovibrionales bacterium]|nr:dihydrolipoyl dehydrogenase [Bdellovibrionales bacterium]
MDFDLIVIGSGPGGYTGAIRAAQLGLKTGIVEKYPILGGTCLNVGCIPSKALLDSSEHYHFLENEVKNHGVDVGKVQLNLSNMMKRKDKIVSELTGGVNYLMKKNKIEIFRGHAQIISPNEIKIGDSKTVQTKNIMIATGSKPRALPFAPFNKTNIISSTEALNLPKLPKSMVVIGGGYIGLELGSVWKRLGVDVHVVEFADRLCPALDKDLSQALLKTLKAQGLNFYLSSKVTQVESKGKKVEVVFDQDGKSQKLNGDIALVSIGRIPYTEGLGLETCGIEADEKGFLPVNSHYQTLVPSIYAIGDVIGGAMLAHKAEEEGVAVAERIARGHGHVNYKTLPSVIYTWPEVAVVGLTQEQAKEQGLDVKTGRFPFTANGRAKALGCTEGFVKIISDKNTDEVLGVHIIGPRASDMIAEAVIAMEFSASTEDIARGFHAHPTLSEVVREAALSVDSQARQI